MRFVGLDLEERQVGESVYGNTRHLVFFIETHGDELFRLGFVITMTRVKLEMRGGYSCLTRD